MAYVQIDNWWKAKEIPLIEADWRNIRIYCEQEVNPFNWDKCLYIIRLAPPYAITYGDDCELSSPLVYVGSGNISNRWSSHRDWLYELGHAIPGGRYEVWVCQPKCQNIEAFYEDIEADILTRFREKTKGYLPLRNKRVERTTRQHEYGDGFFNAVIDADRRYDWAMYPLHGDIESWYSR